MTSSIPQSLRAIIWLTSVAPATAYGAPPLTPRVEQPVEELSLGELVFPQDSLELQGTLVARFQHDSSERPQHGFPNAALLALGITDRVTVDAELPVYVDADAYALSLEAGLLYNLLNSAELNTAVSVLVEGRTAAIAGAADADGPGLELEVIGYRVLGPVHVNLALGPAVHWANEDHDTAWLFEGSAAVLFPLEPVVPMLELDAELGGGEVELALAPGVAFGLAEQLELALAGGVGLTAGAPDYFASLTLTRSLTLGSGH